MKFRNNSGNRVALEVITPSGKITDYVQPYDVSMDYEESVVKNSRDFQIFQLKKILIPVVEGTEQAPAEEETPIVIPERVIRETVGEGEQIPTTHIGTAINESSIDIEGDASGGSSVISKAPNSVFAKEKTIVEMATEQMKTASEVVSGVLDNKEALIRQQEEKIKKAVEAGIATDTFGGQQVTNRISNFNKLGYFAKKAEISKTTDKAFLAEVLAFVPNENVKALARARIQEIANKG